MNLPGYGTPPSPQWSGFLDAPNAPAVSGVCASCFCFACLLRGLSPPAVFRVGVVRSVCLVCVLSVCGEWVCLVFVLSVLRVLSVLSVLGVLSVCA